MKIKNITIVVIGLILHFYAQAGEQRSDQERFEQARFVIVLLYRYDELMLECLAAKKEYDTTKAFYQNTGGYGGCIARIALPGHKEHADTLALHIEALKEQHVFANRVLNKAFNGGLKDMLKTECKKISRFLFDYDSRENLPKKDLEAERQVAMFAGIRL